MKKLNNGYYEFTREELVEIYENNTMVQPKAKTSNDCILRLLNGRNTNYSIACELTRSGRVPNRGSVVECVVKHGITKLGYITKSNFGESDLNTSKQNFYQMRAIDLGQSKRWEIKFANGFADATPITSDCYKVVLVTPYGIWKFNPEDIIYNNKNRIQASIQNYELATRMYELEKYLGY
jgi:hypothetical protein